MLSIGSLSAQETVDLLIHNGTLYSVDSSNSVLEAVAVRNERVFANGFWKNLKKLANDVSKILDLQGRTMIPGFIESHAHLLALGKQVRHVSLVDINTYEEMIEKVVVATKEQAPGTWILGREWHQSKWDEQEGFVKGFQTHHQLSEKTEEHPVMLIHASGHALFVNEKAMQLAGLNEEMDFGEYAYRTGSLQVEAVPGIRSIGHQWDRCPSGTRLSNRMLLHDCYLKDKRWISI